MKKSVKLSIIIFFLSALSLTALPREQEKTMTAFKNAKFGLFIHFGVYSMYEGYYKGEVSPRYAEWIALNARIPVEDYRKMGMKFNPVKYNPEEWAKLAKECGMKYVVITTKHHEGFAMFDTKISDWSVMKSEYGKDIIGPLAKACKKDGLMFGAYYSQSLDWVNGGQPRKNHWDQKSLPKYSFDDYLKNISLPQVKELLAKYPEIDIMWWDMPKNMTKKRAQPFYDLLAKKYPHIIQNPRLGKGVPSNFGTFEQNIPAQPITKKYWESCMTINHTWGYRKGDDDWKSSEELIHNLIGVVSKGGNYLLNVGPKPDGTFPKTVIRRMKEIGKWMKVNGEAIYGTTSTPFVSNQPWRGACTQKINSKGTTLYLHVFDWPSSGKLPVLGLEGDVADAYILKTGQKVEVEKIKNGFQLTVPKKAPDKYSSTVVLRMSGKFKTHKVSGLLGSDGAFFDVADAKQGSKFPRFNAHRHLSDNWKSNQTIEWDFDAVDTGEYWVKVISCSPHEEEISIACGDETIRAVLPNTGDWKPFDKQFKQYAVGTISIKKIGPYTLTLTPFNKKKWLGVNINSVEFEKVKMVTQDAVGNIHLPIYAAKFTGDKLLKTWDGVRNWSSPSESLDWDFMITRQGGTFDVVVKYASEKEVELSFILNEKEYTFTLPSTGGEKLFLRREIGKLPIPNSGKNHLKLKTSQSINLADLKLWNHENFLKSKDIVDNFPFLRANYYLKARGIPEKEHHPEKLMDGDLKTFLTVGMGHKKPLIVDIDLGEIKAIKGIKILSTGKRPAKQAVVSVRVKGKYQQVATKDNLSGWVDLDFSSVKTRFIKIDFGRNSPLLKLNEIKVVYGK